MKHNVFRALSILLSFLMLLCPLSVQALDDVALITAAPVELNLPCKSAVLIEQTTGEILYEKNPDERLPIASVTKIMTLLLVMEALEAGTISKDENVPISELAASMGGSQVFLEPGEEISLDDVLKAVFVSSANDGAVALAELVSGSVDGFVAAMNEKASVLGMTGTIFFNPTGLDDGETNLSTARDVALMSKALLAYESIYDYSKIWIDTIRNGAFGLSNTNKLVRFYPGATGLKTGSTGKAKYCVSASAERNGLKLCAVVLAGDTSADRFQCAKTLLDHGFANYAFYQPEKLEIPSIRVWGGKATQVTVDSQEKGFLLSKGDSVGLTAHITVAEELTAPVEQGQTVGKIQYKKGSDLIREIPLFAKEDIPALQYSDILRHIIRLFFCGAAQ